MITHIAIFKWKKSAKKGEINNALRDVSGLKSKIPGIIYIACGENFSKHGKNFTHAVVVTAKNKSTLKAYREHPDHVAVAEKIGKMEKDGIGIDFETSE